MYYTFSNGTLVSRSEKDLAGITQRIFNNIHYKCEDTKYVNKRDMQSIIKDAAESNEILYVEFKKKDGEIREMYCVPTLQDEMGRQLVVDIEAKYTTPDESPMRKVDLREISLIKRLRTNTIYVRK